MAERGAEGVPAAMKIEQRPSAIRTGGNDPLTVPVSIGSIVQSAAGGTALCSASYTLRCCWMDGRGASAIAATCARQPRLNCSISDSAIDASDHRGRAPGT
ncbi:MAG TPA: hypothetical protein VFE08_09595 [Candidatus Sulfotelmatobacter sp.]|nr:hypothetical protein [Candidatus Sulfotelmatobacter sp.]